MNSDCHWGNPARDIRPADFNLADAAGFPFRHRLKVRLDLAQPGIVISRESLTETISRLMTSASFNNKTSATSRDVAVSVVAVDVLVVVLSEHNSP